MTKITSGITRVVTQSKPIVSDFDGNDALLKDQVALRQQVQQFAIACLPEALRKALFIVQNAKSAKDVIQAAKFIKSIADGQVVKQKTVNGIVKRLTNDQLNTSLQGTDE